MESELIYIVNQYGALKCHTILRIHNVVFSLLMKCSFQCRAFVIGLVQILLRSRACGKKSKNLRCEFYDCVLTNVAIEKKVS